MNIAIYRSIFLQNARNFGILVMSELGRKLAVGDVQNALSSQGINVI
jgi:hypothetical protein